MPPPLPTRRLWALAAATALATAGDLAAQQNPPAGAGQPVVWGQEVFVIPYQWSGAADRSAARQVVLYLSTDRGASWSEVTRARPDVRSFMYRAPGDGEYWFAIRTLDPAGRAWPHGPMQAELRVVVDTQIPHVAIERAEINARGEIVIEAVASDPQLDQTSVQISCQDPTTGRWVQLKATVQPTNADSVSARATAPLPRGVTRAPVRVSARDRAGNPASAGVLAASAMSGAANSTPTAPRAPPAGFAAYSGGAAPAGIAGDPFANSTAAPLVKVDTSPAQPASQSPPPLAHASTNQHASDVWLPDNSAPRVDARAPPNVPATSTPHHFASAGGAAEVRDDVARTDALVVNSSRFELQYELRSVGRWGVSKVEVWGTSDNGRTWRRYAVDSDLRSPVDVETPGAGLFGFRILVQSVGGLEQDPPAPGDRPQMHVEVDLDKPSAQLTDLRQGDGYFADHLMITWTASDPNLDQRSVALLYADRPSGPWAPIASNLENSGSYSWRLRRHMPRGLYVRLEVRDRAGNVGVDQTERPVTVHIPESSGRIRDVRPIGGG